MISLAQKSRRKMWVMTRASPRAVTFRAFSPADPAGENPPHRCGGGRVLVYIFTIDSGGRTWKSGGVVPRRRDRGRRPARPGSRGADNLNMKTTDEGVEARGVHETGGGERGRPPRIARADSMTKTPSANIQTPSRKAGTYDNIQSGRSNRVKVLAYGHHGAGLATETQEKTHGAGHCGSCRVKPGQRAAGGYGPDIQPAHSGTPAQAQTSTRRVGRPALRGWAALQGLGNQGSLGVVGPCWSRQFKKFMESNPLVIRRNPPKSDHRIFSNQRDVGANWEGGEEYRLFPMISNQFQSIPMTFK